MEKVLIAMAIWLSVCLYSFGNNYKILYLTSNEAVSINGKRGEVGDIFSDSSILVWLDHRQVMKVSDVDTNEQYIICAQSVEGKKEYSLSDYFFLEKKLSSRNGEYKTLQDLSYYFRDIVLIDSKVSIPTSILQDDTHFFYLVCHFQDESINKAIKPNKDSLVISVNKVFQVDGTPILPYVTEAALYYYDAIEEFSICVSPSFLIVPVP